MRIPFFEIKNVRGVSNASCETVPPLMLIAGPHAAGKSTLLYELRKVRGRENILYIGPHRSSRRQQVKQRDLYDQNISFEAVLCQDSSPVYDSRRGLKMGGAARDPWNSDESATYLKFA